MVALDDECAHRDHDLEAERECAPSPPSRDARGGQERQLEHYASVRNERLRASKPDSDPALPVPCPPYPYSHLALLLALPYPYRYRYPSPYPRPPNPPPHPHRHPLTPSHTSP